MSNKKFSTRLVKLVNRVVFFAMWNVSESQEACRLQPERWQSRPPTDFRGAGGEIRR